MKRCNPYVGVTGIMTRLEADALLETVPEDGGRLLMRGVLVSSKTLNGQKNKWPGRYPIVDSAPDIFSASPDSLDLIHYSTDDPAMLHEQLLKITKIFKGRFDGFQLNIAWPELKEMEKYYRIYPEMKMVLQCEQKAMNLVGNSPKSLCTKVREYADFVDYVLIDPSGGLGKPLETEKARGYLRELQNVGLCGLGIAGGLSSETLYLIEPLVDEFPFLSIDAEGRLRTPQPEDALNLSEAKTYLKKAFEMFIPLQESYGRKGP